MWRAVVPCSVTSLLLSSCVICFIYFPPPLIKECGTVHRASIVPLCLFTVPPCVMDSVSVKNFVFAFWNVRGLGDDDKCVSVRNTLVSVNPVLACLQETKLSSLDMFKTHSFLPASLTAFTAVDADGSRGDRHCLGRACANHDFYLSKNLQPNHSLYLHHQ
jgi:hypothetical protein